MTSGGDRVLGSTCVCASTDNTAAEVEGSGAGAERVGESSSRESPRSVALARQVAETSTRITRAIDHKAPMTLQCARFV